MAYQVLARKWRPQTFEDLIGQEFSALTLKNSVKSGKLAHALLFSGPRGVGKTSTARIVAKAINCEKKQSGSYPCKNNQCTSCLEISESRSLDVQEIDAASHTGVNDIREIIENVRYMPNSAEKKVYIIDEVHMLSQSAFNALLKTLEEPPDHVLFILATTEIHKIPATILSRCQRYDFKKVGNDKIQETLKTITEAEGIEVDERTLFLIAKESEGSLRDSLSLLDQLISTFDSGIEYEKVVDILGILDNETLKELVNSILEKDPKKCIELVSASDKKGISPKRLIQDLTQLFRDLVYIKICGSNFTSDLTDDEKKEYSEMVKGETVESLEMILNILIESSEKIHRSFYPEISLELSLIKLSTLEKVISIDEIMEKLNSFSEKSDSDKPREPKKKIQHANNGSLKSGSDFTKLVKKKNKFLGMRLEDSESIEIDDSTVKIKFPSKDLNYEYFNKPRNYNNLRDIARDILLREDVSIKFESGKENSEPEKKPEKIAGKNRKDPVVDDAIRIFEGRLLRTKPKVKES